MEAKNFTAGAILGVVAGVLGGILLAPKSGPETRGKLMNSFSEIKDKVAHKLEAATEFSKGVYDRIVGETVASYRIADKITPEEAAKISEIFEKGFADIEKILEKEVKKVVAPMKQKEK